MPITAYTTILGGIVMLGSWFLIGQRIKAHPLASSVQVRHLHSFFLMMGLFFTLMFLPNILITANPSRFPIVMAWGYAIAHIFLYIALTYVARLFVSMVPRLVSKDRAVLVVGTLAGIAIFAVNIATMPLGTLPSYNSVAKVVEYNAAPAVGAGIAVFATVSILPTAILMIVNGVRNPNARARSFLLGAGLFVMMAAGPLHDNAHTAAVYAVADVTSMFSLLLIAGGILYRFEERLPYATSAKVSETVSQ
jgi:hypothetical protein